MCYNLLSSYAIDALEPFVIWGTVGILGALILAGIIIFFAKRSIFTRYVKIAFISFVFFALVMGISVLAMEIAKHYDPAYLEDKWVNKDIVPYVFVPSIITVGLILIYFTVLFFTTKKTDKVKRLIKIIGGVVCALALLTTLVLIAVFYTANIADDGYYSQALDSLALYLSAGGLVVLAVAAAFILGRKEKKGFDTRCLAIGGICVALSFALSYVKLFKLPQGGSVTLASMLPIMLFSYIYGIKKGLLVGLLYGMLQAVQDPYIVHPAQFLLDYPIAYTMVGFTGILGNVKKLNKLPQLKFALGAVIAGALRFMSHVLSGVFAFGAYAIDVGQNSFWLYSLAYNSYIFVDVAIVILAGILIFSSKAFNREVEKLNPPLKEN